MQKTCRGQTGFGGERYTYTVKTNNIKYKTYWENLYILETTVKHIQNQKLQLSDLKNLAYLQVCLFQWKQELQDARSTIETEKHQRSSLSEEVDGLSWKVQELTELEQELEETRSKLFTVCGYSHSSFVNSWQFAIPVLGICLIALQNCKLFTVCGYSHSSFVKLLTVCHFSIGHMLNRTSGL